MYKEPEKTKATRKDKVVLEEVCDVCGKTIGDKKAKTDVTRFLSEESRCQCIKAAIANPAGESTSSAQAQSTGTVHLLGGDKRDSEIWRKKFESALSNLPKRYQFLSLLGEGGMGTVFKVLDTETHKLVAVKMLRHQFVHNNEAINRFKQEAKSARKLDHPNLTKIYDFGVGTEGTPYLVMEYHEGQDLGEVIRGGHSLEPYRAVTIFIEIAKAAQYAHEHNIIHRDIKPSNIILERKDDGDEHVRLVDFGIAKTLLAGPGLTHGLTQTGDIFGSPPYMPPEQCEGRELDAISDIYAFGCVMYECLTGRTPFEAKTPIRMILKHLEEIPAPISSIAKHPVPKNVEAAVMRCLEKDRSKRYSSMASLANDLEQCLSTMTKPEQVDAPAPVVARKPQHEHPTMFIMPGLDESVPLGHLSADDKIYLRSQYQKLYVHQSEPSDSEPSDSDSEAAKLLETRKPTTVASIITVAAIVLLLFMLTHTAIWQSMRISMGVSAPTVAVPQAPSATVPALSQANSLHPDGQNATRMLHLGKAYFDSGNYAKAEPILRFSIMEKDILNTALFQRCNALSACCAKEGKTALAQHYADFAQAIYANYNPRTPGYKKQSRAYHNGYLEEGAFVARNDGNGKLITIATMKRTKLNCKPEITVTTKWTDDFGNLKTTKSNGTGAPIVAGTATKDNVNSASDHTTSAPTGARVSRF